MTRTPDFGERGEKEAARYLEKRGLRLQGRRFGTRWGEIDLVARDGETWVFVEVKARRRLDRPSAADAVTPAKQQRLIRSALLYMKKHRLEGQPMRFDVLLIEEGRTEWIPDAFQSSNRYTF